MDLLLTHAYFLAEDPKEQQIMKPYPPLGLLYLSSHLRAKGFGVEIYDSTFGSFVELEGILENEPPATLGLYVNLMTRPAALRIVQAAKRHGWKVVLGGPEPSNYVAEYLEAGADLVVEGEGEATLEEILAGVADPAGVHRLGDDGNPVFSGPRAQIPDLDAQPWPDRERIDLAKYLEAWRGHHGSGSLNIITARGCPYHCNWCSHSTYGKTHRRRSPAGVADEVEWMLARYDPEMLWMADDVFTIHPGWILKYAAELKRRGIERPFECITRADRLNERMADALAELGCFRLWIGSESGSQRILDSMQRGVTVEQVQRAVALCKQRGIETGMFLMWGYEGEELADIEATVQHVKTCLPDIFFTTVSYPIKGTPYFDRVSDKVEAPSPWNESSDRDFSIRGRKPRDYYALADTLLKTEVSLQRLRNEGRDDAVLAETATQTRAELALIPVT